MNINPDNYKCKISIVEFGPLGHIINLITDDNIFHSDVFTNPDLEEREIEIKDYLKKFEK